MSEGGAAAGCALCGAKAKLKRSHIIPRFVYRGLKVPDGPTRSLLCGECEDRFSESESTFARVVFHPLVADGRVVAKYDKWLLQFAASICWRVLGEQQAGRPPGRAEETWRQFLLGKRPDVGEHPIHLLRAAHAAGENPIEMTVAESEGESFVYARLGPVILLGLIADPEREQWQGTRISLAGKLKPREAFVPARYRDYLAVRVGHPAKA